jgi:hypothetical protein
MKYPILLVGMWLGLATSLCAQNSKLPPLPEGPLLKRAPDSSAWTVTFKGNVMDGIGRSESPLVSKIVKNHSIILEQNTDSSGQQHEVWHVGGLQVSKVPNSVDLIINHDAGGTDIYSINFEDSDFAGLDWLSAATFVGIEKFQGRDCMIFKSQINPLPIVTRQEEESINEANKAEGLAPREEKKVAAVAYIDLETRIPLLVQFGQQKRTYEYGPATTLTLPPEVAKALKVYLARIQQLAGPIPKA